MADRGGAEGRGPIDSLSGSRRLGLANVARLALGPDASVGDLGAALGALDGLDETHCQ
jgi:hypothetical protein